VPAAIYLARDGTPAGSPRRASAPRVYIEGASPAGFAITAEGLRTIRDDPAARQAFIAAATDFSSFLNHWAFVPPGQAPRLLGADLWAAQAQYAATAAEHPWIYFLKARQLGESTVATAYDGWVARFGPENARAHVFTQRDVNAVELLADVAYGLDALPEFLRLPLTSTAHTLSLNAGPKDRRTVRAYPANVAVRGASAVHVHLDEWCAMLDPQRVWAAVEPTIVPGGTCHILTTGTGPIGYPADEWRKAIEGSSRFHPCFIDALQRPDRTPAWYEGQRASMHPDDFAREYPLRWEDALSGGGDAYFSPELIDLAAEYAVGLQGPQPKHRYVTGWDIGLVDATVGITLDVTGGTLQLVNFVYLCPTDYGEIQWHIEDVHRRYRGVTVVESNAPGAPVIANLIGVDAIPFFTSVANKGRILAGVHRQLQIESLKWNPKECSQLDTEMRNYRLKDEGIHQDTVMALAFAVEHASEAHRPDKDAGRILAVIRV
jgi:hypothetical protein